MTPEELHTKIREIFGSEVGAVKAASRALPINYQNLRNMLSGRIPVSGWIPERLGKLLELKEIAPPPESTDNSSRKKLCTDALNPHIAHLVHKAEKAGWVETEIFSALNSFLAEAGDK